MWAARNNFYNNCIFYFMCSAKDAGRVGFVDNGLSV
jgi:hypothetical protein